MERPRPSTVAWGVLGASVLAYEAMCPEDELLSQQCDRWLDSENKFVKFGTYAVIGATALHLANCFDAVKADKLDPYHQLGRLGRYIKPSRELA